MEQVSGSSHTRGSVAYVPQEAWLLNDTIRNNVLFGQQFDQSKYKKVLAACALDKDLDQFPAGDFTLLGEKGVNLSSGQKQRISLARAAYSGADVILLDDPLSSVDTDVGQHIFHNLLGPAGLLREKTRVMVTHGVQWLNGVDLVLLARLASNGGATVKEIPSGSLELRDLLEGLDAIAESCGRDGAETGQVKTSLHDSNHSAQWEPKLESRLHSVSEDIRKTENADEDDDDSYSMSSAESLFAYLNIFGYWTGLSLVALLFASILIFALSGVSIQVWSDHLNSIESQRRQHNSDTNMSSSRNAEELADTVWQTNLFHIMVYASETLLLVLVLVAYQVLLANSVYRSTKNISRSLQWSVLRSPLKFFETTPIGKIALRFGHDVNEVGHEIPQSLDYVITGFLGVAVSISVVCFASPESSVLVVFVIPFMYKTLRKYLVVTESAQSLIRKYEDVQYSRGFETVEGLEIVRAFGHTNRFIEFYEKAIDDCGRVHFNTSAQGRWMSSRLLVVSSVFTALSAMLTAVASSQESRGSKTGLAITYALEIGHNSFFFALMLRGAVKNFTSISRLMKYLSLPGEAVWERDEVVPKRWPTYGKVEYKNLCVSYNQDSNDQLVLKDVTLTVLPGQKIGVVGRTGAGKTTLVLSLFRLLEPQSGAIFIDDVDISTLGLHELRSKVGIIPQDPVLFSGSLRSNLDQHGHCTEEEIWTALRHVDMENSVRLLPGGLEYECEEGGSGLSLGQKQLLCMARALMRKCQILVLDEATSSVDLDTDRLLQSTLRHEFSPCTVFTIAHRLDTVMDYDRILVVDSGRVVEFDTPSRLIKRLRKCF